MNFLRIIWAIAQIQASPNLVYRPGIWSMGSPATCRAILALPQVWPFSENLIDS